MPRRLRSLCLSFLLSLCLVVPLAGEALPAAAPAEVGLSAERLERLVAALRAHVDRGELAGTVTLVARRGKVAHFEAVGRLTGEGADAVPMRRDALFGIASMTKPITSAAVMMLVEEGRLRLEHPVSRYLPELSEMTVAVVAEGHEGPDAPYTEVPAAREITVRDLLRHTSGLTYDFLDSGPVGKLYREKLQPGEETTLADLVDTLGELPLASQPGSGFVYGLSTDVLGRLVEVVSGQSLDRFFDQRIFGHLGMTDTAFYVPAEKAGRLAALYAAGDDGRVRPAARPFFRGYSEPPALLLGGAGLVSTAADYARFLQTLLNGGRLDGVRLLSRKSVELMTVDHLGGLRSPYPGYGFGLGFAVRVDLAESASLGSEGEYAWGGIFNTTFFVDPKEELLGILMTQSSPHGHLGLSQLFKTLVYQAIDD